MFTRASGRGAGAGRWANRLALANHICGERREPEAPAESSRISLLPPQPARHPDGPAHLLERPLGASAPTNCLRASKLWCSALHDPAALAEPYILPIQC